MAMERVERRLPAILAAACEDMAKQQIKNISRPVRVYRLTMDRGAPIGMQTAPLLLPDKLSVAALLFTNMSGDLDQEFFADGKRRWRDHDFSVQSVAALGAVIK